MAISRFQPGQSGNPNGRPVGSRNQKTSIAFGKYLNIFETNLDRLKDEIEKLEGKELADVLAKMAPYIFPTLSKVSATNFNTEDPEIAKECFVIGGKVLEF